MSTIKMLFPAVLFVLVSCSPSTSTTTSMSTDGIVDSPTEVPSSAEGTAASESEQALVERARGIHERVITIDTHADINTANFTETSNYTQDLDTQVNLPKMIAGGLDVAWFIVYTGQGPLTPEGYVAAEANALDKFSAIHRLAEQFAPDTIEIAYTSDDVRRIDAEGRKVAMIGVENAYPMGLDLGNVQRYQEMGARYMSLAHNGHSQFADSNTGERDGVWLHGGLSDLGRQAVAELNRWGVMIDLSHPSRESNLQTLALSKAPVIASHSSARALNDVSRNLSDEELLAIRDNGGVVQATAFRSYLDSAKNSANVAAMNRLGEGNAAEVAAVAPPVDVADFINHVDYMVGLIGIEHVGLSSDFDGGGGVSGWNDASETFNVTLELVRRGYTEEEIALLWSGNLLRVLDEVQRVGAEIRAGR